MTAKLDRDKARLVEVCEQVDATKDAAEALYEQRDTLLRDLKAKGVSRAELLELSGMSTPALKWVLADGRAARRATGA